MTRTTLALVSLLVATASATGWAQAEAGWTTYRDPEGRFRFEFPASFGTPERGTDSGFGNRVAAIRFSGLMGLGGEAALIQGPVSVDIQALGGLYDPLTLQMLPPDALAAVLAARPAVTPDAFCRLLGAADHLGPDAALPGALVDAARGLDRMRNIDPQVLRCVVDGGVATFHKTATFRAGTVSARQHIHGALRFLSGPYSAFQIVRAGPDAPSANDLAALTRMVRSFSAN
jgi:hypothetical protein